MGCVASVPAFGDGGSGDEERAAAQHHHPHHPAPSSTPPAVRPAVRPVSSGELYAATAGFSALRLLGEGGFGRVFEGVWADGRAVAVKVLDSDGGHSLQGAPEFWAEVTALAAAAPHAHVVPLLGVCNEGGDVLASVLARAAGGSLRAALAGGDGGGSAAPLPWSARLRAAAGAAAGLAHLHSLGWAHGDVSAGNVLLTGPDGHAWLSDLGLARRVVEGGGGLSPPSASSPRPGTPTPPRGAWGYLAPELVGGGDGAEDAAPPPDGRPTRPADVWALGVVFLELLTGGGSGGGGPHPPPPRPPLTSALVARLFPALEGGNPLAGVAPHLDARLFEEEGGSAGGDSARLLAGPPAPQAAALAEAAAACLALDPAGRPPAATVAAYLAKALASGGEGGGRVTRPRGEEGQRAPPPPPARHDHAHAPPRPATTSLMDDVTALDGGPQGGGNPFL